MSDHTAPRGSDAIDPERQIEQWMQELRKQHFTLGSRLGYFDIEPVERLLTRIAAQLETYRQQIDRHQDQITRLLAGRQAEQEQLRGWLWLHHGCPIAALYGDDGEMQCNAIIHRPPLDFKRDPLEKLFASLQAAASVPQPELGLNIDMIDADRLRTWAEKFETHGADVGHWGSVPFIVGELRRIAAGIEQEVRDVGEIRDRAGVVVGEMNEALQVGAFFNPEHFGAMITRGDNPILRWRDLLSPPVPALSRRPPKE